jgi:uncharacterized membrane protein
MADQASLENGIAGNYQFDIASVLSEAWQKTEGAKLTIILAALAYTGVAVAASFVIGMIFGMLGLGGEPKSVGGVVAMLLQQLVIMAITLPLIMGMFMMGLKRSVDQPITVGMIFGYYDKTVNLVLTALLMYVLLFVGYLLLILPGIYLTIAYYLALPLVVEKNLSPWEALEARVLHV